MKGSDHSKRKNILHQSSATIMEKLHSWLGYGTELWLPRLGFSLKELNPPPEEHKLRLDKDWVTGDVQLGQSVADPIVDGIGTRQADLLLHTFLLPCFPSFIFQNKWTFVWVLVIGWKC